MRKRESEQGDASKLACVRTEESACAHQKRVCAHTHARACARLREKEKECVTEGNERERKRE